MKPVGPFHAHEMFVELPVSPSVKVEPEQIGLLLVATAAGDGLITVIFTSVSVQPCESVIVTVKFPAVETFVAAMFEPFDHA